MIATNGNGTRGAWFDAYARAKEVKAQGDDPTDIIAGSMSILSRLPKDDYLIARMNIASLVGEDTAKLLDQGIKEQQKADKTPTPGHDELRDTWIAEQPPTAYSMKGYRRYDAGTWSIVEDEAIEREMCKVIQDAKPDGVKVTGGILASVARLARAELFKPSTVWDADPGLLVCQNGVLHVQTRVFRDHDPLDYAISRAPFDYEPDAVAPAWLYYLSCLPIELVGFLQEWAGYCITTDTRHEMAVWLYGVPGSGKSTYITGLQAMLGDKAGHLSLRDIERSRFALARLPGKTLMVATEAPENFISATDVLNSIISGEPVTVEAKFRDSYDITPRAKITWAMNALPRVANAEDGIFRRVKVVEFPPIPEGERDIRVKEDIATEGAGILNWALEGLARLQERRRFNVPQSVNDATDYFKANNDIVAVFIGDCCVIGGDKWVKGQDLYDAYRRWCERNNYKAFASNRAAQEFKRLGYTHERKNTGVVWSGIGLLAGV